MPEWSRAASPRREASGGDGLPLETRDIDNGEHASRDRGESALPAGRVDEWVIRPACDARGGGEIAHGFARLCGYPRYDDALRFDP